MKNFTQFLIKAVAMVVLLLLFSYVRAWVKQPAESTRHESFRSDIERTMHESDTQFGTQWTKQQLGDLAFEAPMTLRRSDELSAKCPDPVNISKFDCYIATGAESILTFTESQYKTDQLDLDVYLSHSIGNTKSNPNLSGFQVSITEHPVGNIPGKIAKVECSQGTTRMQFSSLVFTKGGKLWHFLIAGRPSDVDDKSGRIFGSITMASVP